MKAVCSPRMNTQSSLVWCCVVVCVVPSRHLEGTTILRNICNYSSNDTALHCIAFSNTAVWKKSLTSSKCWCHFTTTGNVTSQQTTVNVIPYTQLVFINNLYHHCSDPESLIYNQHSGAPSPGFRQLHVNLTNNVYVVSTWRMGTLLPPCVCMCSHHKA